MRSYCSLGGSLSNANRTTSLSSGIKSSYLLKTSARTRTFSQPEFFHTSIHPFMHSCLSHTSIILFPPNSPIHHRAPLLLTHLRPSCLYPEALAYQLATGFIMRWTNGTSKARATAFAKTMVENNAEGRRESERDIPTSSSGQASKKQGEGAAVQRRERCVCRYSLRPIRMDVI